MDNATASPDTDAASRRRSGRVSKAPAKFSQEPVAAKRKRSGDDRDDDEDDDVENELPEADEDISDATDDQEPAVRRPRQRSKRPPKSSAARKPAVKKPKTNGVAPDSLNKATNLPSRPKKTVAISSFAKPGDDDLYADVFLSAHSVGDVAEEWLRSYHSDDARAVKDLVNFVLRSCGCDLQITEDDIRDPDNSEARLTELQELFQEEPITEYPLISRAKGTKSFRELFTDFFHSLIGALHDTEVLYKDDVLLENISRWIASMSTSSLRPFRHTATTAILSLVTGLVDAAETLDKRISGIEQQIAASQKGKNKAKLAEMNRSLDEANRSREQCGLLITDFFDTTFIHRYRDIDSHIRTECVEALGHWIMRLPNVFMEPGYLRYLGWMLSDVVSSTRHEVLKQLGRIFKRDAEQLGHFIERFQPRLVEMATKDAEVSVRVAAISVCDTLRSAGLLQPEEVDAIGRLIFDSEIRVRRAAVAFFNACVQETIDSKVAELGGDEVLDEVFGEADEDNFESPRKEWVDIKSLAELLAAYDAAVESQNQSSETPELVAAADVLQAKIPTTRIATSASVLSEKLDVVRNWEQLAGYLLFDHTVSSKSRSKSAARNAELAVKKAVGPDSSEETILLEVLAASVTFALAQPSDADRSRRKGARHEATDAQEEVALTLASLIPRLLNKFGADPNMAKVILQMEHALNPSMFQQLRQDSSRYEKLLDEVSVQFNRHDDKAVIAEAAISLSLARQHDDLEEVADGKLSLLWENVINSLRNFDKTCELRERGNLSAEHLTDLSSITTKMSNLAKISDCIDILELEGRSIDSSSPSIEILAGIVNRGTFAQIEDRIDDLEDEVVTSALRTCQFYFMWKVRSLEKMIQTRADIADSTVVELQKLRRTVQDHLINTLSSRALVDEVRLLATQSLCDIHILFGFMRNSVEASGNGDKYKKVASMAQEITPGLLPELVAIFDGIERRYAKKTKKVLNEPADDEDPVDDEPSDDEDEDEGLSREQRYMSEIKDEHALCDLAGTYVRAIVCKVADQSGPHAGRLRKRLLRNQNKLGKNYQEVVAYLDNRKRAELLYGKTGKGSKASAKKPTAASSNKPAVSEEIVVDDDDEQENVFAEADPEEGSREDLRRRELLEDDEPQEDIEDSEELEPPQEAADEESVLGD